MKNILALTALALGLVCTTANAASLKTSPANTPGAPDYELYLAGEGTLFDVVDLTITPLPGVTFLNPVTGTSGGTGPGNVRSGNDPGTFANRMIDRDPGEGDGGKGWAIASRVVNATTFNFVFGPNPAVPIVTALDPGGRLFLGQIQTTGQPSSGSIRPGHVANVSVALILNGVTVQTLTGAIVSPEPASFGLAGIAAIAGMAFRRRRSA